MRKNLIRFLFQKYRFGVCILLSALFLVEKDLLAQAIEEQTPVEKRQPRFELLIKRQTYRWIPYDYTSFSEHSPLESSIRTDSVKQNQKVIVPLTFRYDNVERNFRVEISAYEIELANANTNVTQAGSGGYQVRRQYFNPMIRSEAEFNYYKILNLSPSWKLFAGAGIRNINKYKYGYYLREGGYQEYFYTYGPQLVLNTEYKLWKEVSVQWGLDLFYTQGNRFYKEQMFLPDSIVVSNGNAGVKGIYRGYEIDLSLSYRIFDTVKFFAGYNYIYSYFSYYGFGQTDFNFGNPQTNPFPTQAIVAPTISRPVRSGNYEILQGFYLGVAVGF
ncbi:LA_2444/LA_4059 family outer membrane protein [Leptospira adleri]|uniref:Outer membrane protein, TIGR04327 family n=1 Tax=Leptospira adleri TaxID=2023186 RepID=A0A2M9YK81_9LEPT|nr:LA_2444/LA_4059 family outer membrane protein [Leptospira adleri]PJZ51948.1 hypothetical protein CH380_17045 [Leptospira adleri]PJZ60419.1 hypothetical protein CH376_18655 [Leptospira adleri]